MESCSGLKESQCEPQYEQVQDSNFQSLLKRPKQNLQRNYLAMNKEAVRLGYASLRQVADFRTLHGDRPATDEAARVPHQHDQTLHQRQLPVPMTFGVKTYVGDPMHELMSNKYFGDWQQSRYTRHAAKSALAGKTHAPTQPTMTRTAMLRSYQVPAETPAGCADLWKLPRFEKSARPQLNTFRTERARQAAVDAWHAEQSHRLGLSGLGICAASRR